MLFSPFVSLGSSLAANGPGGPRSTGSTSTPSTNGGQIGLDLVAMGAQPADLAAVGLTGFQKSSSYPGFALADAGAEIILDPTRKSLYWDAAAGERMRGNGFVQFVALELESVSATGQGGYFATHMTEFATAEGAHARWRELADAAASPDASLTMTLIEVDPAGDETLGYRLDQDGKFAIAHLLVRVSAVVVDLSLYQLNYAGADALPDQLSALATTVLGRIEQGAGAAPGLANHLVFLGERPDLTSGSLHAQYLAIGGATLPTTTETEADVADRADFYAQNGVTDSLTASQYLYGPAKPAKTAASLDIRIRVYASADLASEAIAAQVASDTKSGAEIVSDSSFASGDESAVLDGSFPSADGSATRIVRVLFRLDAEYVSLTLTSAKGTIDVAAIEEISAAHAACLAGTGLCGLIDAPAGIVPVS
jgi:hypothetical protein